MEFHHIPVLFDEVMEWMQPRIYWIFRSKVIRQYSKMKALPGLVIGEPVSALVWRQ